MATLSTDLRQRILKAYDKGGVTRQDVAERFDVSLGMVKKLLQQRRKTGDIAARHCYSGNKPKITEEHKSEFKRLVDKDSDMTLEELRDAVGLKCSVPAVFYALEKMDLSLKKRRLSPPNNNVPTSRRAEATGRRR